MSVSKKYQVFGLGMLIIFGLFLVTHLYKLVQIPNTLYFDEVSIGHNAALISKSGVDEWGYKMPVYFKAFGEYKNPLYIYTSAVLFKFFGVSDFVLRFTSFVFSIGTLVTLTTFSWFLFKSKLITTYIAFVVAFLPWFFTLSRISFEVISQTTTFSLFLLFVYLGFENKLAKINQYIYAGLAGIFLSLTLYSYSTSRFLVPAFFLLTILIYLRKPTFKKIFALTITFLFTSIPYISFYLDNKESLALRFKMISHIYNQNYTILEKLSITTNSYLSYFSPQFLLIKGDLNLRHSTGFGGQIYAVIVLLFLIGLIYLVLNIIKNRNKFEIFLLLGLFLSPIAASLVGEGMHSLRSVLLGIYIVIISCYSFYYIHRSKFKNVIVVCIFAGIFAQSFLYLNNYFVSYKLVSKNWFGGLEIEENIKNCLITKPSSVNVYQNNIEPIYIDYYSDFSPKVTFIKKTSLFGRKAVVECVN
jgi:membrane-associated phospholipid phosphatase